MTEFEQYVVTRLDEIKEVSVRNETTLTDLVGPTGRIAALEDKVRTADRRNWMKSTLLGPGSVLLHIVANRFGLHL